MELMKSQCGFSRLSYTDLMPDRMAGYGGAWVWPVGAFPVDVHWNSCWCWKKVRIAGLQLCWRCPVRAGSRVTSMRELLAARISSSPGWAGSIGLQCLARKTLRLSGLSCFVWGVSGIPVFVSVTHLTRLETRTKESNMCASHWVAKPKGAMKVNSSSAG